MSCCVSQAVKSTYLAALFVLTLCARVFAGNLPMGSQSLAGFIGNQFGVDALIPPLAFNERLGKNLRPGTIIFGDIQRVEMTQAQPKRQLSWDITSSKRCLPQADHTSEKASIYSSIGVVPFGADIVSDLFDLSPLQGRGVLAASGALTDLFSLREPSDRLAESQKQAEQGCSALEAHRSSAYVIKGLTGGRMTLAIVARDHQAALDLRRDILSSKNSAGYNVAFGTDESTLLVSSRSPMLFGAVLSKLGP